MGDRATEGRRVGMGNPERIVVVFVLGLVVLWLILRVL